MTLLEKNDDVKSISLSLVRRVVFTRQTLSVTFIHRLGGWGMWDGRVSST